MALEVFDPLKKPTRKIHSFGEPDYMVGCAFFLIHFKLKTWCVLRCLPSSGVLTNSSALKTVNSSVRSASLDILYQIMQITSCKSFGSSILIFKKNGSRLPTLKKRCIHSKHDLEVNL